MTSQTQASSISNASTCPLCGRVNQCAMEIERATGQKQDTCWCATLAFTPELLARVPIDKRNLACICADCAKQSHKLHDH